MPEMEKENQGGSQYYHGTHVEEIQSNPAYWNMAWASRDLELFDMVKDVAKQYYETHVYIQGETDCNDMAIDIWNMLHARGVTSIIVVGNLDMETETFSECNHTWLIVYADPGEALCAIEPTNGEAFLFPGCPEPKRFQYCSGFFYAKPSDLRADFGERW